MPDFPNEIVRGAGDREIAVHREDLAFLFPEEFHDVSAGVLLRSVTITLFPASRPAHFSSPVA
jgi:hypothetical protein